MSDLNFNNQIARIAKILSEGECLHVSFKLVDMTNYLDFQTKLLKTSHEIWKAVELDIFSNEIYAINKKYFYYYKFLWDPIWTSLSSFLSYNIFNPGTRFFL